MAGSSKRRASPPFRQKRLQWREVLTFPTVRQARPRQGRSVPTALSDIGDERWDLKIGAAISSGHARRVVRYVHCASATGTADRRSPVASTRREGTGPRIGHRLADVTPPRRPDRTVRSGAARHDHPTGYRALLGNDQVAARRESSQSGQFEHIGFDRVGSGTSVRLAGRTRPGDKAARDAIGEGFIMPSTPLWYPTNRWGCSGASNLRLLEEKVRAVDYRRRHR